MKISNTINAEKKMAAYTVPWTKSKRTESKPTGSGGSKLAESGGSKPTDPKSTRFGGYNPTTPLSDQLVAEASRLSSTMPMKKIKPKPGARTKEAPVVVAEKKNLPEDIDTKKVTYLGNEHFYALTNSAMKSYKNHTKSDDDAGWKIRQLAEALNLAQWANLTNVERGMKLVSYQSIKVDNDINENYAYLKKKGHCEEHIYAAIVVYRAFRQSQKRRNGLFGRFNSPKSRNGYSAMDASNLNFAELVEKKELLTYIETEIADIEKAEKHYTERTSERLTCRKSKKKLAIVSELHKHAEILLSEIKCTVAVGLRWDEIKNRGWDDTSFDSVGSVEGSEGSVRSPLLK